MQRRSFLGGSAACAAFIASSAQGVLALPPKTRNVVLVHGLYADGSCWSDVIERLQSEGMNVTAVQNPLTTLQDAVTETRRVLAEQDGPTVLVAHSFAGTVISEAGNHPSVKSLVFVAARAPDVGEDYSLLAKGFPASPATAGIIYDGEVGRLSQGAFLNDFAGDVPQRRARVLYAVQQPFHKMLISEKTTQAAWKVRPNFYSVSTQDRTINPDLQRFMAKRMKAKVIEVRSSHLSMISHPQDISALVLRAATVSES